MQVNPDKSREHLREPDAALEEIRELVRWFNTFIDNIAARRRDEVALREAKQQAERASAAKSEFLANMSHEIRTPMNGVVGMLEMLTTSSLSAEQREMARTARDSAVALLEILNDILDLSKLDSGQVVLDPQVTNFHEICNTCRRLMEQRAEEKGLRLVVEIERNVPNYLVLDGTRVRQVILNLVNNAVKFTEQGQVTIRAACRQEGDRIRVRVAVEDTGIGISKEVLPRLFLRFSQADSSTTRRFGGSGLGLEISRSLARVMQGDLSVKSELGKGSTFTFEFIAKTCDQEAVPRVSELPSSVSNTETAPLSILVVDDTRVNVMVLKAMLEKLGCVVETATNGAEAVAAVQARDFDGVMMDVMMPVMDGVQATEAIRALGGKYTNVYIVAVTADAMSGSRERYMGVGMSDYLAKPLLIANVQTVLARIANHRATLKRDVSGLKVGDASRGLTVEPDNAPVEAAAEPNAAAEPARDLDLAGAFTPFPVVDAVVAKQMEPMLGVDGAVKMYLVFVESVREKLDEFEPSNPSVALRAAHSIKGAASTAGFPRLAAIAASAEQALRADASAVDEWRQLLELAVSAAIEAGDALFGVQT
jgi:signal transduction histidine kinase/CheY-like chemotaxis protein